MSRTTARENAFKLIYEFIETGERNDFTAQLLTNGDLPSDSEFTRQIYDAVIFNYDFISSVIKRYSKDFAFERIYKTDLAVLALSVCEILFRTDVPYKVSVNEALELSKKYSTEKSSSFVNGVLASVIADKEELINECKDN